MVFRTANNCRPILFSIGLLLFTAAILKIDGYRVSAMPAVGWFDLPIIQSFGAVWEMILGMLLISGIQRTTAHFLSLVTFSAFAILSVLLGLQGVASCGCFGKIQSSPWYSFAIDLIIIAILVWMRNAIAKPGSYFNEVRFFTPYAAIPAIVLGIVLAGGYWKFGSMSGAMATLRGDAILIPRFTDLGSVSAGNVLENKIAVSNLSDSPIRLVGGTTDCSCLTTESMPVTIPARTTREIFLTLKIAPKASGRLWQTVDLWTDCDSQPTLRLTLSYRVID